MRVDQFKVKEAKLRELAQGIAKETKYNHFVNLNSLEVETRCYNNNENQPRKKVPTSLKSIS